MMKTDITVDFSSGSLGVGCDFSGNVHYLFNRMVVRIVLCLHLDDVSCFYKSLKNFFTNLYESRSNYKPDVQFLGRVQSMNCVSAVNYTNKTYFYYLFFGDSTNILLATK